MSPFLFSIFLNDPRAFLSAHNVNQYGTLKVTIISLNNNNNNNDNNNNNTLLTFSGEHGPTHHSYLFYLLKLYNSDNNIPIVVSVFYHMTTWLGVI